MSNFSTTPFNFKNYAKNMPAYKSKLFKRNNGGKKTYGQGKSAYFRPRRMGGFYAPNPRPPVSIYSTQRKEIKALTGYSATLALSEAGQCFHLDQIPQGTGVTDRTGQKHQVTALHIRGDWHMNNSAVDDHVGYMLVWDRQPNEALATPGDIIAGGTDIIKGFPNQDNNGRFIILARKTHTACNQDANDEPTNQSQLWFVDDYFQFSRSLIATTVTGGGPTISDRTSGALILVGMGLRPAAQAANLAFSYRLYFNDV